MKKEMISDKKTKLIAIEFAQICKGYNTTYLDRDNFDKSTIDCMNSVIEVLSTLFSKISERYNLKLSLLNEKKELKLNELFSKRFLFYSLEKEITLQSYTLSREIVAFSSTKEWMDKADESILIQNSEDGDLIYIYINSDTLFKEVLGIVKTILKV